MNAAQRSFLRACHDHPDDVCERYFRTAWPVYRVTGAMQVVEPHPLPIISRLLLQAVVLDIATTEALASTLCIDESDALAFMMGLQQQGLVDLDFDDTGAPRFILTVEGRDIVGSDGIKLTSRIERFNLHYDPLTHTLGQRLAEAAPHSREQPGDPPLRHADPRPILTLDSVDVVRKALSSSGSAMSKSITSLLDIEKTYPEYIDGIDVFVLRSASTGVQKLVAYRDGEPLLGESVILQGLFDADETIVPDDALQIEPRPINFNAFLAAPVAAKMERAVACMIAEIEAGRARAALKFVNQHIRADDARLVILNQRITDARDKRETLLREVEDALRAPVLVKEVAHHRALLTGIFWEFRDIDEVIVVSPRLSTRVIDDEMQALIGTALAKGASVEGGGASLRIGYDYGYTDDDKSTRSEHWNADNIVSILKNLERVKDSFLTSDIGPIDESMILVTAESATLATFDILSFTDPFGGGHTAHVCVTFSDLATVRAVRNHALGLMCPTTEMPPHVAR